MMSAGDLQEGPVHGICLYDQTTAAYRPFEEIRDDLRGQSIPDSV